MASVDHERLFSSLDKTTSSNRTDLLSSSCSENLTEVGNRKNRPENPQDEMYDVFLSFNGGDTLMALAFTDNLFWTLKDHKVNVFIDNNQPRIEASMPLPDEVNQAIKGSRMAVIVFSSTYIDSSTCCLELVNIMELYRRRRGPIVLPIFYDLDPSAVKAGRIGAETWGKPLGWRKALTEAADLAGAQVLSTADGYEGKFIREIVHKITRELKIRNIDVAIHQVGIDSRVQEISNDLDVRGSDDVRIIGIWGMGGLGKTEVAKAIFNKYHHSFDGKSFLQNVREKKLIDLQDQLLFDILKRPNIDVSTVDERTNEIEKRLSNTKVLVIFDDIDHVEQLDALAIKRDSFGVGSRIIITTRDAHLLKILKVDKICPVPTMNEEEALELLSWHAFGNRCPPEEYLELSREVVDKCGGLPLALQSVGSFLFRKSSSVWGRKLDKLKRDSWGEIHENLKISYDKLSDDDVRAIFLDISCFFIGMNKDYVMRILKGCDFYPEIGIRELHDRCLVTVDTEGNLMMHDLIRDLGRDIVRAESPGNSGKQSRLWHLEDVTDVLRKESGTEEIEGLALSLQESDEPGFSTEAFRQMQRLRLLKLNYVKLTGSYMHIPTELRWLCWHGFSLEVIPEDFDQPNLVSIDLSYSKLIRVWVDSHELLENLKFLNLSHSINLERTPDFSKLPNLEELILEGCESLPEVHSSIGGLERLALINLEHCKVLKDLPPNFYNSKSIETLLLNGCSKFEQLAEGLGAMVSLTTLEADNTAIRQIPSSIVKLKNLRVLSLCGVKGSPSTKLLPPYLRGLDSLRELALAGCNLTDDAIPEDLGSLTSLEDLDLENNSFWRLPSLSGLSKLELLCINGCANLRAIPDLPTNLKVLQAMCCIALETMPDFSEMSNVRELYLSDSFKLTAIPGFEKSLNSMTMIHMEGCTNLTTDFRKNIIQEWTSCGYGGIFLDANYIPECVEFVDGDLVDFYVPQSAGRTFKGVTLCCVYSANKQPQGLLGITVTNNTKRVALHAWITYPLLPTSCECEDDYLWQGQLSNDLFNLQGGDEVEIFIGPARTADESVRVKKIGVNPVWDRVIKENKHDSDLHLYDFDPHPKWLLGADDKQDRAKMKSDDGFKWGKYGQRQVRGSRNPRSYYKCTFPNSPVKKKVESSLDGQITEIVYKGNHNHPKPQNTRRSSSNSSHVIQASNPNTNEIFPDQSSANHGNSQMDSIGNPENSSILMGDDEFEQSSPESKSGGGDEFDEADEPNEPNAKRRKNEIADINEGISAPGDRTVREHRFVFQTISEVDILDDGYRWRKYGQNPVKGNPNPRSYYKCTYSGCPAKKHVERASHDLRTVITTYQGKHNHDVPAARGSRSKTVSYPIESVI